MNWLDVITNISRITALPFQWLFYSILYVVHLILSPFLYLGHIISELFMIPIRVIAQFEAIWYFLACAILIGTISGTLIYGTMRICVLVLDLDRKSPPPKPKSIPATGHDAASYRAARAEKKQREQIKQERRAVRAKLLASQPLIQEVVREARTRPITLTSPLSPNTGTAATRSGLFQDIILEQTDESDGSYF